MRSARALAIYALLTVALTWPFAANLRVMDAGDSAFFAWEIGWTVHALKTDAAALPHANIFHPLRYTLGMDEPVLGTTLVVLPLALFTDDAVLLYNVVRLLTFLFSALTAYWLARELGVSEWIALLAGALFAFSPIRTDQVAHLSTLGTQWWPLVLLFTIRFAKQGRAKHAFLAALFFVLAFLACGYHGVIAAAALPPALAVVFWGRWNRLGIGALAVALAGLALLPVYRMHQKALEPERYARATEETVLYAAPLESFLATNSWNRIYGEATDPFRASGPNNLFPGLVVPGLVLAGAIALRRRGERPSREAWALFALIVAAALVALGPRIRAFGADLGPGPWALLRDTFPVFQMIRVTSRAGVFLALPLAMLAALALERLKLKGATLVALGLLAMVETLIAPIPMPEWSKIIDTRREPPPVYRWLAEQPGRDPVVQPADARRLRARAAPRVPREHLHGLLDAPLESARERIRRYRAETLRPAAKPPALLPIRRVSGRVAGGRHPLHRVAPQGLRPTAVGAAAEGNAPGAGRVPPRGGRPGERHRLRAAAGSATISRPQAERTHQGIPVRRGDDGIGSRADWPIRSIH